DFLDENAACEFVVFALAGTAFAPEALQRIAGAFERENTACVYGDLEVTDAAGARQLIAFPAFDYERLLDQGYCAHVFALRRELAVAALQAGHANLYRVFNAMLDGGPLAADAILHLPGAIAMLPALALPRAADLLAQASRAHLACRGQEADVSLAAGTLFPAVHVARRRKGGETLSIIIPTRDRPELLEACLRTITPAVARNGGEIIVVDNGSTDPAALAYLSEIARDDATVIRHDGPFNFARLNNEAVRRSQSDLVLLINNDIEARDATARDQAWLDDMLGRIEDPTVGAVGAMLVWPSGIVQHGGVVLHDPARPDE